MSAHCRLLIALVVSSLVCRSSFAADGSPALTVMTLAQATDYARAHRPLVRSALAALAARKADASVPRARWLPQLGGTAQLIIGTDNESTSTYFSVPEAPIPRVGATKANTPTWVPSPTTLVAIAARQEVYDFGRIAAQAAVSDALVEEARANADAVALDVQLGVEEAYASVLAAKQVLAATDEALKRATTHRNFAEAGVKRELKPPIDLTRAQAELSAIVARRIRANGGLAQARAALAASIGYGEGDVDAAEWPQAQAASPSLDEALRLAVARNPAIVAALARERDQHLVTSSIARELLPNLSLGAGLAGEAGGAVSSAGTQPYGQGWLPDLPNWYVGLVLQWSFFDGTVLARKRASRERELQAAADRDETTLAVSVATRRAWIDLQVAVEALPALTQTVDAARANLAQADARFRNDLGNIIELSDAEATLINAQLDLAIGQFAVARARAALGRALGDAAFAVGTNP